jgi:hypothetical protein
VHRKRSFDEILENLAGYRAESNAVIDYQNNYVGCSTDCATMSKFFTALLIALMSYIIILMV